MINVHDWKVTYNNEIIAQVLSFVPNVAGNKVLTKALDGTVYIQTVGSGIKHAKVEMLCSREQLDSVNESEAEGGVITVVYRDKTYIGYWEEAPEWEAVSRGEWYKTTMTLLIEEEVRREGNST